MPEAPLDDRDRNQDSQSDTQTQTQTQDQRVAASRRLAAFLCNCGLRGRPRAPRCKCITVRGTPIDTPDLAIYSQAEQLASGSAPTWDSPDIVTNSWGPFRLNLEAQVTIRNLSPTVSAANALVHYYTSPFGIGTQRQLRLSRMVTLGPGASATLLFPLHQEVLRGDPRAGVHIQIAHPGDRNSGNNAGSQMHDGGYTTESGRDFVVDIPVVNDSGMGRQISLVMLPTDLLASVTPSTRMFAPFEQIVARLRIQVPPFLVGTPSGEVHRAVTVMGRTASGEVIGGATRLLRIND